MATGSPISAASSPSTQILWPGVSGRLAAIDAVSTPVVWDVESAMRLPSVARAVQLYSGMIKQMPLDDVRGVSVLPRGRLLDQPDPNHGRAWFIDRQISDYLLHGNALALVTARDAAGWPAALAWLPAVWTTVLWEWEDPAAVRYFVRGRDIPQRDVIHVQRGADPWYPVRGVGVVEGHLATLDRVAMQEEYERSALADGGVPSVAVITNNPSLGEDEATAAKAKWAELYGGATREPGIFPAGTSVVPLAWSPTDADLVAARQLSLTDIANIFNLDGYWLGAPTSSLTYRSPGPMYLNLLRTSLEPVITEFEDVWSAAWLPRGRRVTFDRNKLLRDDMATTVDTMSAATAAGLLTIDEARAYMGWGPLVEQPIPPPDAPPGDPASQQDEQAAEQEEQP